MNRRDIVRSLAAAPLAAWLPAAMAQSWPDRLVRWVLSQPAASGPDNVSRLLAERLQHSWGQTIMIDNKPGGQNIIGAQTAARSKPDGYTFYFATTAALITNPLLFKELPYDPQKDFVPVAFIARSPFAILVEAKSPVKTVQDLVARCKADPGKFSIGNEGPRTFSGMISRLFATRTHVEANQISYASVSVGTQDLMGGHIDSMVADLASTAQLAKQGRLRVLATTSPKAVPGWEQVPTLSELLPGFDMVGWFAMMAPTGTPASVVSRVNQDLNSLLQDKDIAERIAAIGPFAAPGMTPDQVGAFLQAEKTRWSEIVKEIGILPE